MRRVLLGVGLMALLTGCAGIKDFEAKHNFGTNHVAKHAAPVAKPVVVPAPVVVAPAAPIAKETFKHRWLKKLFRDRVK